MIQNRFDLIPANAAHSSMRFHRLMKEHGIYQNSSPTGDNGLPVIPKTSRAIPPSTPAKSGKKRKLDQSIEPRDDTDDEGAEQVKKKCLKKSRKTSVVAAGKKEEAVAIGPASSNNGSMLNDSIAAEDALGASIKVEEHGDVV